MRSLNYNSATQLQDWIQICKPHAVGLLSCYVSIDSMSCCIH